MWWIVVPVALAAGRVIYDVLTDEDTSPASGGEADQAARAREYSREAKRAAHRDRILTFAEEGLARIVQDHPDCVAWGGGCDVAAPVPTPGGGGADRRLAGLRSALHAAEVPTDPVARLGRLVAGQRPELSPAAQRRQERIEALSKRSEALQELQRMLNPTDLAGARR